MNALQQQELEEIEVKESFKVTDIETVNWCFRKLNALKIKESEITSLMDSEVKRLTVWYNNEKEGIEQSKEYFEGLIAEYLLEQKKIDPKVKISTPFGKANTRKQQPKFTYNDGILIDSLKDLGLTNYIKTVEEVKKAELKKDITVMGNMATTSNGEVIEGITIEEQADKVSISLEV